MPVTQKLRISCLCVDFIQVITDMIFVMSDVNFVICRTRPWTFIISRRYFQDRYGDLVFYALRDDHSCEIFKNHDCIIDSSDGFGDI